MRITELNIYPMKSTQGIALQRVDVTPIGLQGDRRLVVVDQKGMFITARRYAELLRVVCREESGGWSLQHPGASESCRIQSADLSEPLNGVVWKDEISALDAGDAAARWLSDILGVDVRIAVWQDRARIASKYDFETSFADASPILVTTEASLRQACEWAGIAPDMRRFRPNIVLQGDAAPFAEDGWRQLRIGDALFDVLDGCTRCILTTRDPDTGDAHPAKQPMKALMENHANEAGQPLFGMNVTLARDTAATTIAVGDEVVVVG